MRWTDFPTCTLGCGLLKCEQGMVCIREAFGGGKCERGCKDNDDCPTYCSAQSPAAVCSVQTPVSSARTSPRSASPAATMTVSATPARYVSKANASHTALTTPSATRARSVGTGRACSLAQTIGIAGRGASARQVSLLCWMPMRVPLVRTAQNAPASLAWGSWRLFLPALQPAAALQKWTPR